MAATMNLFFFSFILIISSTSLAQTSFHPKSLILPITKDSSTKQYITQLSQRTPLVQITLTLDLGGESLWVNCDPPYTSSTYRPARCGSAECSLAHARGCGDACLSTTPRPGCNNHTCSDFALNPVGDGAATSSVPGSDVVYIRTTDGRLVSIPHFIFVCPLSYLLNGLATGVTGMAGLGRTSIALPSQLSSSFSLPRKFFMCLPSSKSKGVVIFGNAPSNFFPKDVIYTPLIKNPIGTAFLYFKGEPSAEYYITVKSIKVAGKLLSLNTTLLAIDKHGNGGTKISTITPYTILETSIYSVLLKTFISELSNVPRVASIAPFGACFKSTLGANVPEIDLVLQSESVVWRIFGENSMVSVGDDVLCFGFVDGGVYPRTTIVIGGHQIEDNLLLFDLASSRLGFSSSLLGKGTSCGNLNITSNV